MAFHSLSDRERALSLWVQDRLHERAAIEWATKALKRIHGELGNELMRLFEFLDECAQKHVGLDPRFQRVWRLFHVVARESGGSHSPFQAHELRQQLQRGNVQPETADKVVELVRPRLTAKELSPWAREEEDRQDDPLRWVAWSFEARAGSVDSSEARFGQRELQRFPKDVLLRLLERGTAALADAIRLAAEVGWLNDTVDLPNLYVHRVLAPAEGPGDSEDGEDDGGRDPDAHDDHFAPLVRLLSSAFQQLAQLDAGGAGNVCYRWDDQQGGLFLRLAAFARWDARLRPAADVAAFLEKLPEEAFWQWMTYPEIATLRATRWNDLPSEARARIEERMVRGPSAEAFGDSTDSETVAFRRDHELARIVDNGGKVTDQTRQVVQARRRADTDFPRQVPAVEPGAEGARVTGVPDGDPTRFDHEPQESLLAKLQRLSGRRFGEGDDAEAFGRTLAGKVRIVEALEKVGPVGEGVENAWQLLLSYPPQKADDAAAVRELAEKITSLTLHQSALRIAQLTDRLSYWLDQADEVAPGFEGAEELWAKLLSVAAALVNKPEGNGGAEKTKDVIDLSMAALNEPLGHLISMFLRRCPSMPGQGERPPLPAKFAEPLKKITGRARELMANRLAVHMRYFERADRPWLESAVLEPMMSERPEGDRLWEAFAKYGQVPSPDIWTVLEPFVLRRLASARLSPEASDRLTEMVIVVWSWSKDKEPFYSVNATALRGTLGLAPDGVRTQAAWQFQILVRRSKAKNEDDHLDEAWPRFGKAFFAEVWPLEPALQSPKTANHLAGVPGQVGERHFVDAVETILPFLRPFEVWSLSGEFWLGKNDTEITKIVQAYPEVTLRLLTACLSPAQRHRVIELTMALDRIVASLPSLQGDARVRMLRRLAD